MPAGSAIPSPWHVSLHLQLETKMVQCLGLDRLALSSKTWASCQRNSWASSSPSKMGSWFISGTQNNSSAMSNVVWDLVEIVKMHFLLMTCFLLTCFWALMYATKMSGPSTQERRVACGYDIHFKKCQNPRKWMKKIQGIGTSGEELCLYPPVGTNKYVGAWRERPSIVCR